MEQVTKRKQEQHYNLYSALVVSGSVVGLFMRVLSWLCISALKSNPCGNVMGRFKSFGQISAGTTSTHTPL